MSDFTLDIKNAFTILFDCKTSDDFAFAVKNVDSDRAKRVFREKIKRNHPDLAALTGESPQILERKFKLINEAYRIIEKYCMENCNPFFEIKDPFVRAEPELKPDIKGFYPGAIPRRSLRFAEFLYYKRMIDWETLIKALVWQYKKRPRFGDIARVVGFFDDEKLSYILRNMKVNEMIGEAAVRLNVIDNHKLYVVLGFQRRYNLPIGTFFIKNRILTKMQLDKTLVEIRNHNFSLKGKAV